LERKANTSHQHPDERRAAPERMRDACVPDNFAEPDDTMAYLASGAHFGMVCLRH
jgi:hypothetical protein